MPPARCSISTDCPEVFGGHPRDARHPHPGLYPGACSPQAWSAGAVILLVQTMLGLTPLAPRGTLVVDPALPAWLPEVTIPQYPGGRLAGSPHVSAATRPVTPTSTSSRDGGLYIVRPSAAIRPGADRMAVALESALDTSRAVRLAGVAPAP